MIIKLPPITGIIGLTFSFNIRVLSTSKSSLFMFGPCFCRACSLAFYGMFYSASPIARAGGKPRHSWPPVSPAVDSSFQPVAPRVLNPWRKVAGNLVLKYYAQICVVTRRTECVSPRSVCSPETDSQIKYVQLWKETVRLQIATLNGSAVNQEGMTL